VREVLLGLRHAHGRGVVHRDIKPDNIFLATKNGQTVVKILDFGIAKLCGGMIDDQQATRDGITVGTPKYLSPEQAVGGAITPAADVYSVSVVLYEMLVGRPPFDAEDPLTLMTAHAGGDVPAFRDVAPDLEMPERVEALVRRGLSKLPAQRIGSAVEYVNEIDEILGARTAARADVPRGAPAARWIGVLAVLVAIAGALAFVYRNRARSAQSSPPAADARQAPAPASSRDHDAQLAGQLHVLQGGTTCAERKKAVAKLVELADPKAVPALKKARARGDENACLRASADEAIKKLGAK
jgi:hypothetical protein